MSSPQGVLQPAVIIFDFFGVIANDQYDVWLKHHGLKRQGAYAAISKEVDIGAKSMQDLFDRLSELTGIAPDVIEQEFHDTTVIDSTLVALISDLNEQGRRIALLSNSCSEWLRNLLKKHELEGLFDEVVISADERMVKPDAAIFKLMLERLHISSDEALYIDDRQANVDAATQVGMKAYRYVDVPTLKLQLGVH